MTEVRAITPPHPWAADETEAVAECPACGASAATPLHHGLGDPLRPNEPGRWDLAKCTACGSAYLSPRPTSAAIGHAYDVYFTHQPPPDPTPPGVLTAFRRAGVNGHLNARLGYQSRPTSRVLAAVLRVTPGGRAHAERSVRSIPAVPTGGRVLDIGCANGAYLVAMRARGWDVLGVETDPQAITFARAAGLDVLDGLLDARIPDDSMDAVTLGHVIEHVHDPDAFLGECLRVLRPGGRLWLATPNLDSSGHRALGRDYVQLDPPRHLVLFTRSSLRTLLMKSGFTDVRGQRVVPQARAWTFARSMSMRQGLGSHPDRLPPLSPAMRARAALADLRGLITPARAEEIVFVARKPLA